MAYPLLECPNCGRALDVNPILDRHRIGQLEAVAAAVAKHYDAMAAHYGDEPEDWWPQLYEALSDLELVEG